MDEFNENKDFSNALTEEAGDVVSGVEQAKKHTGAVVGGITAGVLAIAAGGGVVAYNMSDFVKNQVKVRLSKPENYYSWVVEKNTADYASQVADRYREMLEEQKNGQTADISLTFELSSQLKEMIEEETDSDDELGDFLRSLNSVSNSCSYAVNEEAIGINDVLKINGKDIVSAKAAVDLKESALFFCFPELSEKWIYSSALKEIEYDIDFEKASMDAESIITPDELETLAAKYSELYTSLISDVTVEKKAEVSVSDIDVNYIVTEVSIDEEKAEEIASEFLKAFKEDELLRTIIVDRIGEVSAEEYDGDIDNALSKIQKNGDILDEGTVVVFKSFIDPRGDIRGIELSEKDNDDTDILFVTGKEGSEIRGEMLLKNNGEEEVHAVLAATDNNEVYSGNIKVSFDEEEAFKAEFTDLSAADKDNKYVNGNIRISVPEVCDFSLALVSDGNSQKISSDINIDETDYGKITLEYSVSDGAEVAVPDKSAAYDLENEDYSFKNYVEQDKFESFLNGIFERAGINKDNIAEDIEYYANGLYGISDIISDYDDYDYDDDFGDYDDDSEIAEDSDLFWEDDEEFTDEKLTPNQITLFVADSDFFSNGEYGDLFENVNAEIKGNGEYTVKTKANKKNFSQFDKEGPEGISFIYITGEQIDNSDDAEIIFKSVKVDGREIDLSGRDTSDSFFSGMCMAMLESELFEDVAEWSEIEVTFEIRGIK